MFWRVRRGIALGQPLDPEDTAAIFGTATGKARAKARAKAAPEANTSDGPAPSTAPADPSASAPVDPDGDVAGFQDDGPIWVPENITGENREAMIMMGAVLRSAFKGNDLAKFLARPFPAPPTSSSAPPSGSEEPNAG
jgi:hypothetical protein